MNCERSCKATCPQNIHYLSACSHPSKEGNRNIGNAAKIVGKMSIEASIMLPPSVSKEFTIFGEGN